MSMLGKPLKNLSRSLVASLFALASLMPGAQVAMSHDTTARPGADNPRVFKTVPNGTPTDRPGRGLQFLCIDEVTQYNGGEAPVMDEAGAPWVHGLDVVVSEMPLVDGQVSWKSRFKTITTWTTRRFVGNGLPRHVTGEFPVQPGTDAYPYYNAAPVPAPYYTADKIPTAPYQLDITVPRSPVYHKKPVCISNLISGVATQTGSVWHANIALGNVSEESLQWVDPIAALPPDECFGHPFDGQYHYHGWSWRCFPNQGQPKQHSPLFGYALDGFGIYGPRGERGKPVTNADLDECHGHFGMVEWDGYKRYMYHYHLNNEYPYGPGCLKGRPIPLVNDTMMKAFSIHKNEEGKPHVH